MITLTIEKSASLKKVRFKDIDELRNYLGIERDHRLFDVEFKPLDRAGTTKEMRHKASQAKRIPLSTLRHLSK
ncbi:MAG: hypothetical protein HYS59_00805 [Candidatus Vogelbacteria bacterium]|nr:hypothetical protein [Candidatus Vogelbacteria bacterium]